MDILVTFAMTFVFISKATKVNRTLPKGIEMFPFSFFVCFYYVKRIIRVFKVVFCDICKKATWAEINTFTLTEGIFCTTGCYKRPKRVKHKQISNKQAVYYSSIF